MFAPAARSRISVWRSAGAGGERGRGREREHPPFQEARAAHHERAVRLVAACLQCYKALVGRFLASLVVLAAVAAAAAGPGQGRGSSALSATVTLKPFNPQQVCKFSPFRLKKAIGPMPVGTKTLVAQCGPVHGTVIGSSKAVDAAYNWNWYLQIGPNGKTTGLAGEYGALTLVESGGTTVQVLTTGLQAPVGPQTSTHAKGLTTGTWRATGAHTGSGTYTFTTERTGSTFTVARLQLKGSISG